MKRIYFDYAASTPLDPEVFEVMKPYFSEKFGNAGSLHSFGQEAQAAIDRSRETIAKAIGLPPAGGFREIVFTGSATEANNLVLRGAVKTIMQKVRISANTANKNSQHSHEFADWHYVPRIVVSAIEHESVLETAKDLEKEGVEIIYLPVDKAGVVDLKKLEESLNERTILVSVMYVNNETGSVQPIEAISKIIKSFRNIHEPKPALLRRVRPGASPGDTLSKSAGLGSFYPIFHTDAVQAFQYFDCDVRKLGVDLMTLSAHKIYGPKGVGALYIRDLKTKNYQLKPLITGGGQEFGLRSGTENVPAIVGFGKAAELVNNSRELESERVGGLRDYFWRGLKKIYPKAEVNGCQSAPHILNVYFPDVFSQDLLIKLDMAGIAVSSGAACSVRSSKPSHVLKALGFPMERIRGSLRFSFGAPTGEEDVKSAIKALDKILNS